MATPYTSVSISGYNSSPPEDDGSQVASNQLTWAKHKNKLSDPLKAAIESIDTNIAAAFNSVFDQTSEESSALVTPADTSIIPAPNVMLNVIRFGVTGDGSTDNYDAIVDAVTVLKEFGGGILYFPPAASDYICDGQIDLDNDGIIVLGNGGSTAQSAIKFTHTTGHGFNISKRSCKIIDLMVRADSTRRDAGTASDGIHLESADVAQGAATASSLSRNVIHNVEVRSQPRDGIHNAGGMELGGLINVTVADCVRHGFVGDDGSHQGRTNKDLAPFMYMLKRVRVFECGGNGIILGKSGETTATRNVIMDLVETLGCCWDSGERESLFQMELKAAGINMRLPNVEDQQYANTTTQSTGRSRTGLATPAEGIRILSGDFRSEGGQFSSVLSSFTVGGSVDGVHIGNFSAFQGAYATDQSVAVTVPSSATGIVVRITTGNIAATTAVQNQSANARLYIDDKEYIGTAISASDFEVHSDGVERTISSGVLTISEDVVYLVGEGDTTDAFATLRLASGINGYDGLPSVRLINLKSYTITLTHNTGNMEFRAGTDLALTQYQGVTLHYSATADKYIQV